MTTLAMQPHFDAHRSTLQSHAPMPIDGHFAFARLHDNVCLVQTESAHAHRASALTPLDVNVFRHEFATMFRYSHRATIHPNDIHVLAPIDAQNMLCEESGVVFVSPAVRDKLLSWTKKAPTPSRRRDDEAGRISRRL